MANFLLFKYKFEPTTDHSLFSVKDNETLTADLLSRKLDETLKSAYESKVRDPLNLYAIVSNRKGETEPEPYHNDVLQNFDGVSLVEVRNSRIKKYMPLDGHEEKAMDHFPICWVIVDTRPGSSAILVQLNNAFSSADFVMDLIESFITRELNLIDLNWKVSMEKRVCKGKIWDIVRTRTFGGHDRVKSVTFKFNDKRKADQNCAVDVALRTVLSTLASPDGELKLISDDPTKKLLDETMPDVVATVDMLIENDYHIAVGFDKSGSIEYGKNADAIYGAEDKVCNDFASGNAEIGKGGKPIYEIVFWLNSLMPDDGSHEYTQHTSRKRKRNKNVG